MRTDIAVILTGVIVIFITQIVMLGILSSKKDSRKISEKSEEWYRQQINKKDCAIGDLVVTRNALVKKLSALQELIRNNQEAEEQRFEDMMRPIEKQLNEAAAKKGK